MWVYLYFLVCSISQFDVLRCNSSNYVNDQLSRVLKNAITNVRLLVAQFLNVYLKKVQIYGGDRLSEAEFVVFIPLIWYHYEV